MADATHILADKKQPVRDREEPGQGSVPKGIAPVYTDSQLEGSIVTLETKLWVFL